MRCVLCEEGCNPDSAEFGVIYCINMACQLYSVVLTGKAFKALSAKLGAGVDETAWLVEDSRNNGLIKYRTMDQEGIHWTEDVHKAIRFARREDAEMFAAGDEDAWHIVEHIWVYIPPRYPKMAAPMQHHQWSDGDLGKYCLRCKRHYPAARIYCDGGAPQPVEVATTAPIPDTSAAGREGLSDEDCSSCKGSEILGEKRGVKCLTCNGRGTVAVEAPPAKAAEVREPLSDVRKLFEHWYYGEGTPPAHAFERGSDGESYKYMNTQSAWVAWQGAVRAIEQAHGIKPAQEQQ